MPNVTAYDRENVTLVIGLVMIQPSHAVVIRVVIFFRTSEGTAMETGSIRLGTGPYGNH